MTTMTAVMSSSDFFTVADRPERAGTTQLRRATRAANRLREAIEGDFASVDVDTRMDLIELFDARPNASVTAVARALFRRAIASSEEKAQVDAFCEAARALRLALGTALADEAFSDSATLDVIRRSREAHDAGRSLTLSGSALRSRLNS